MKQIDLVSSTEFFNFKFECWLPKLMNNAINIIALSFECRVETENQTRIQRNRIIHLKQITNRKWKNFRVVSDFFLALY